MEKRLIAGAVAVIIVLLLLCTRTARANFEAGLSHIEATQVQASPDRAVLLPGDACFIQPDGSWCVYALSIQPGPFGQDRVYVREVSVTCKEAPDGMMEVRGIYDRDAWYVTQTSTPLSDNAEVIGDE